MYRQVHQKIYLYTFHTYTMYGKFFICAIKYGDKTWTTQKKKVNSCIIYEKVQEEKIEQDRLDDVSLGNVTQNQVSPTILWYLTVYCLNVKDDKTSDPCGSSSTTVKTTDHFPVKDQVSTTKDRHRSVVLSQINRGKSEKIIL